jgi:hypothetical protein
MFTHGIHRWLLATATLTCIGGLQAAQAQEKRNVAWYRGNSKLVIEDLRLTPIDDHHARISGKIKHCSFDVRKEFWRREPIYTDGTRSVVARYRDDKVEFNGRHEYVPERVTVSIPFGPDIQCNVLQSGEFSGTIVSEEEGGPAKGPKYSFVQPKSAPKNYSVWNLKWFPTVKAVLPEKVEFYTMMRGPEGPTFKPSDPCTVWYCYVANKVLEEMSVRKVTLTTYEKNSRLPVEAEITVSGVDVPTREQLRKAWTAKFDAFVANEGISRLPQDLLGVARQAMRDGREITVPGSDAPLTTRASTISFNGAPGATYKIETRHPRYYYFSDVLALNQPGDVKRAILLIEIGKKQRGDDEGHGGEMVPE